MTDAAAVAGTYRQRGLDWVRVRRGPTSPRPRSDRAVFVLHRAGGLTTWWDRA